jgi:hypothetical protein
MYINQSVYVKEKPRFMTSISSVKTAIAAFIGYIEKSKEKVTGDLHLKRKRITSMVEY